VPLSMTKTRRGERSGMAEAAPIAEEYVFFNVARMAAGSSCTSPRVDSLEMFLFCMMSRTLLSPHVHPAEAK
jgi:hypothetical protein